MITIVLTVSRSDYIEKVISSLELLDCDQTQVNILCIVDGGPELYVKARNLVNGMKYNQRLTVQLPVSGDVKRYDIAERRRRITAAHNFARTLISHNDGYVFSVEDDTTFSQDALKKLVQVAINNRAFAIAEGVELGRWGVPYVGAWKADDVYKPKTLTSLANQSPSNTVDNIDAGGLYCTLIRADVYKEHAFECDNGLGPDINFGLKMRQLGFENFIHWGVPCTHHYEKMGEGLTLSALEPSREVTLVKENDTKWNVSY